MKGILVFKKGMKTMRKSLRLFSCAVLGAAILAPTVVGNNHAQADSYYGRGYYNNYYPNYGYNYGYNGYYPGYNYNYGYNYGYNGYYPGYNYNYGYNYGYNNYYPNYNYGYNYGYNNYNPGYNNYNETGTYRYSNGYLYYILSDGSYYVNYNGRWVRGGDYNNNNSGSNNTPTTGYEVLRNDPHYRYENGTHYYLKDNGDYYYYSNGKWVLVKASSTDSEAPTTSTVDSTSSATSEAPSTVDSTSSASSEVASTVDSTSSASSEVASTVDSTSSASSEVASTVDSTSSASSEVASTVDSTSSASSEAVSTVDSTSSASSEVASTVDSTSATTSDAASTGNSTSVITSDSVATSETGSTSETSSEAPELEKPPYAPETNIDYDKLPKPTLPPTDYRMYSDPRFVDDNGTYYYRVAMTDEENARGIDGYYKWVDGKWKLYNGTANDDPELDPDFHKPAGNDEYMYDDNASSVKLYSENVVGTGKAGEALPFQNVDEFKDYVIKNFAPKFLDNAGWDCNVTWEIEDVDNFNASKGSAWARDYVITANLKSGVDDKKYSDVEFGYVKFVYHVEPTENSDYVEVDSAKAAFNEINAQRTSAGLPALTWSDDLYNSTTLPHAKDISHTYSSDGIVYRRESDGSVVANKWLSSGIRELLMSPDATQAAVACVVAGDGTYYWTLNYQ